MCNADFYPWNFSLKELFFVLQGLVLELNEHKAEYSDIFLSDHATYILVEKQTMTSQENSTSPNYVCLLENCVTLLPTFKLRVSVDSPVTLHQSHKTSRAGKSGNPLKSCNKKTKRAKAKSPKDLCWLVVYNVSKEPWIKILKNNTI